LTLALLYLDEREPVPMAIATDRNEDEIRGFLHFHGYRCRPRRFMTWPQIFPEGEYNEVLFRISVAHPKGVNFGRHAFYELAGDVALVARKFLAWPATGFFTRAELANVLADSTVSYQSLFDWQRHARYRTYSTGMIELHPFCPHGEVVIDCRRCLTPAAIAPAAAKAPKRDAPEWRPARARRSRRNVVHASPARWEEWRGTSRPKNSAHPKSQTEGPS